MLLDTREIGGRCQSWKEYIYSKSGDKIESWLIIFHHYSFAEFFLTSGNNAIVNSIMTIMYFW